MVPRCPCGWRGATTRSTSRMPSPPGDCRRRSWVRTARSWSSDPTRSSSSTATTGRRCSPWSETSDSPLSRRSARAPTARSWCSRRASATEARLRRLRHRLRLPSPSPSDAAGDDGLDPHVGAIDLQTGELAWSSPVQLDDIVRTPITTDDTTAYVGDLSGHVTAIELSSAQVRWSEDLGSLDRGGGDRRRGPSARRDGGGAADAGVRGGPRSLHGRGALAERRGCRPRAARLRPGRRGRADPRPRAGVRPRPGRGGRTRSSGGGRS